MAAKTSFPPKATAFHPSRLPIACLLKSGRAVPQFRLTHNTKQQLDSLFPAPRSPHGLVFNSLQTPKAWFDRNPIKKWFDNLPLSPRLYQGLEPYPHEHSAVIAYELDAAGPNLVEADWDEENLAYEQAWKARLVLAKKIAKEKKRREEARQRHIREACLVFNPMVLTPRIMISSL
jgi:hypothetical protein